MKTSIASAAVLLASLSACASVPVASGPASACTSTPVAPDPAHTPASQGLESCSAFSPAINDFTELPAMRVGALSDEKEFSLPADAPKDTTFIQCERSSLIPLPYDYKVLAAGYHLAIASGGRVAMLSDSDSLVNYRPITGEFTQKERSILQACVDHIGQILYGEDDDA